MLTKKLAPLFCVGLLWRFVSQLDAMRVAMPVSIRSILPETDLRLEARGASQRADEAEEGTVRCFGLDSLIVEFRYA